MGGDLNLKKSWHPQLMSNQKRVWEEQRKALDERRRIEEVQKEHAEQRNVEELRRLQEAAGGPKRPQRVEFLYNGPGSGPEGSGPAGDDREAYLLGTRRLDSLLKAGPNETDGLSKSARLGPNSTGQEAIESVASPKDIASKVRDDPLFALKKKQQNAIEAALADPVRRRQMAKVLGLTLPDSEAGGSRSSRRENRANEGNNESGRDDRRRSTRERDDYLDRDDRHRSKRVREDDSDRDLRHRSKRDSEVDVSDESDTITDGSGDDRRPAQRRDYKPSDHAHRSRSHRDHKTGERDRPRYRSDSRDRHGERRKRSRSRSPDRPRRSTHHRSSRHPSPDRSRKSKSYRDRSPRRPTQPSSTNEERHKRDRTD